MLAGADLLVVVGKAREIDVRGMSADEQEGRLVAIEVHAIERSIFVSGKVEDDEIELLVEIGSVEDAGDGVGAHVVDLLGLCLAGDRCGDGASLGAFFGFLYEFFAYGCGRGLTGDFDVGIAKQSFRCGHVERDRGLTVLTATLKEVRPRLDEQALPAERFFEVRSEGAL